MSFPYYSPTRTFAVDPSPKGFGFAVFEGMDCLLDWGVAQVWSKNDEEMLVRLETYLSRYKPSLLVLEDMENTQRRRRAVRRIADLARYGLAKQIPVQLVSREAVRALFSATGSTKYEIAVAIAKVYPELEPRLPRRRKLWTSEDERMNIFDAVSFALVALHATGLRDQLVREAA